MGARDDAECSRRAAIRVGAGVVGATVGGLALGACHAGATASEPIHETATSVSAPPFKVGAGETRTGEHFKMKGVTSNTLDVKISGADTGGRLTVMEQIGQSPNGGPPLHIHPDQDEFFYVLEGDYQFEVGGQRMPLSAGETIFLPRGVPHAFVQLSVSARMIVAYQPAGEMEAFFRETSAWTSPPSKEEIAAVFAAHGMKVVGPPISANPA